MYGSGFDVGQIIICKFGLEDDSESIARLASSTSLQCFSRAGEAGNVTIGIGNSDVGFTYSKTPFELVEVTRIIRVYPTQVPVNTDTQITIEGSGFHFHGNGFYAVDFFENCCLHCSSVNIAWFNFI
eukprot:762525-Hanusia_phi.AAC.2